MKAETRIDREGRERRVILLQGTDYRSLKKEWLNGRYVTTIWLVAAEFRSGDIVVNQRTREEPGLKGRFELLEEIDHKWLTRNGVRNYYQKWTAEKFRDRLGRQ